MSHEAVFSWFTEEVRAEAGISLRSVTAYGSSVTGEFRPQRSDYNFLVVAEPVGLDLLDRFGRRMPQWRKKRITPPLVVDPGFMRGALDSYPLEFLSMKARYRVLFGEDVLRELNLARDDVRLQCERELRSKLLLFRGAYIEAGGAPRRTFSLIGRGVHPAAIARAVPALVAIFRGLLYLKDEPWQATGDEFWDACARRLDLSPELIAELRAIRERRGTLGREDLRAHFGSILTGLEKLCVEVDAW